MALAPLTRSKKRAEVILFTIPFHTIDLNFLVNKNFEDRKISDLVEDKNVKFFVISAGSTSARFKGATDSLEKKINERLEESNFAIYTVEDGVKKVMEDKNAVFIIESAMTEYYVNIML